ncbi:hypothetical protein ACFP65_00785 [Marinilactibacillus sp. GCM10026970]|uniref:hypothetical protein n=1 Tax=Marinilactibacillus sp. GCM10026970 TaxID=3252642 RepID=UPI00360BB322
MNEEVRVNQSKTFPWSALVIYIVVVLGIAVYGAFSTDPMIPEGVDTESLAAFGVIGAIVGAIFLVIATAIQYAFIKFPTQWVSKEEFVYKYDIWSALFYSGAIGAVINFIIGQLGYGENLILASVVSVITTVLFLLFYFSGEEKESHIKRAIIIVQVAWLIIGIVLTIALQTIANNILL